MITTGGIRRARFPEGRLARASCLARLGAAAALLAWPLLTGCATVPYRFGEVSEAPGALDLAEEKPQIERGQPNRLVDGLGHYVFSLPSKLILLNRRVENHDISEGTEAAISQYLKENGLQDVKVRLNQYAPGGDNFNPFTNTVSLYSDLRPIALHEAGHAKDFAGQKRRAVYALARLLPLVPLYQEARATGDAIGYEQAHGNIDGEKETYRVLYPAYGTYVGGELIEWIPVGSTWMSYAVQLGPVIPAHLIGWIRSSRVEGEPDSEVDPAKLPPPLQARPLEDRLPESLP